MPKTLAVKIGNLTTIAAGSFEDWKETFEVFKYENVEIKTAPFSDYSGQTVPVDSLLYYSEFPRECPVSAPKYLSYS